MLVFTVHEPARPAVDLDDRADELVFVREGFSMPAFLFGPFWLAVHRLWLPLVLYVVAFLLLLGLFQVLPGGSGAVGIVLTLAAMAFGLEANSIRRWGLSRRDYQMIGTAAGKTFEECEHRFLTGWLAGQGTALKSSESVKPPVPSLPPASMAMPS